MLCLTNADGDTDITCPWLIREARVEIKRNDGIFPRIIIDAPYDGVFRASIGSIVTYARTWQ